jgi:hypothetical protein
MTIHGIKEAYGFTHVVFAKDAKTSSDDWVWKSAISGSATNNVDAECGV